MNKYKVGDKVVMEITDKISVMGEPWYVLSEATSIFETNLDKAAEPLGTYTEPLEAKIRRQAAEITRLLAENKELKEENKKLLCKVDSYELYGDQHEEEYNQAFNQGAEAAWELARKITCQPINGGFNRSEFEEIFNEGYISDVFEKYTYSEAAAKVEAWEKAKEEIKVGDEVEKNDLRDVRFIVTFTNGRLMNGVTQSGLVFANEKPKEWHKTGRHIDVDSFLKQIGGNENER